MPAIQAVFISIFITAIFADIGLFITYDSSKREMSFKKLVFYNSLIITIVFVSLFFAFPSFCSFFKVGNAADFVRGYISFSNQNDLAVSIVYYSFSYILVLITAAIITINIAGKLAKGVYSFIPSVLTFLLIYAQSVCLDNIRITRQINLILSILFCIALFAYMLYIWISTRRLLKRLKENSNEL